MDIVVALERASLRVEPGHESSTTVRVRNAGQIVDEFVVEVLGESAGWTAVEPTSVSLFPGAEATVQVRFQPARIPANRAGRMDFGIRASSRVDPTNSTVEKGTIEVQPFREEGLELVPRTSRGWRGAAHELRVTNGGNAPIAATITASDPDRLLSIDVQPSTLSVQPAASRVVQIRLTPRSAPIVGGSMRIPFAVSVDTGSQAPLVTDGAFERRAPLPSWLVMAATGLAGLLVIGVVFAFLIDPGGVTPSPSPGLPTASASAPESQAPASESAAPTESPVPVVVGSFRCQSLEEATATITSSGLVVGTVFPEPPGYSAADDSIVVDQAPASGATVPAGSQVNLIVYDPASLAECLP